MDDTMDTDAVEAMSLHVHLTDGELVARCRTGEPEAWNELVERFSRYVYAICVQAFKLSEHDAEDVFQEVFTRAYEHLDKLRDDNAIRPWLAQLTRRLCIDRLRAGAHEQPEDVIDPMGADETLARLDDAIAVHEALAILPDSCQDILDRFFARDESYRTIGEALDLPSGTIASRISRCLAKLRLQMEEIPPLDRREIG
jgi:RNA polymerase sigma factor (sigma-70 family)